MSSIRQSSVRDALERIKRRALNQARGEPDMDWLVAQGLQLGVRVHIGHPLYIDPLQPWLITIEDHADLAPYVAIITHDATFHHYTGLTRLGRVTIGKRVTLGVAAIILPGTTIGEDSVIGAGAVVQGEIPPGSLVVGNPAKVSNIRAAAAWQLASASSAPNWPAEGWGLTTGITEERKREQREALANGASGYVPARAAPGSPYERRQRRRQEACPTDGTRS